jgi:co-chaperonin GroES (HSP10)
MRIKLTVAVLVLTAMSFAGAHHDFQAGRLVAVTSDERLIEGTTVEHAVFEVEIGDIVYFARGERMRRHGGDAAHGLVVGDPVQAAIDGEDLILQRPDGKEIKTRIIQRKRADAKTQ